MYIAAKIVTEKSETLYLYVDNSQGRLLIEKITSLQSFLTASTEKLPLPEDPSNLLI